ncbi:hypothetical protein YC2023_124098 [Brassica napus]
MSSRGCRVRGGLIGVKILEVEDDQISNLDFTGKLYTWAIFDLNPVKENGPNFNQIMCWLTLFYFFAKPDPAKL